jgi:hypothetical protein
MAKGKKKPKGGSRQVAVRVGLEVGKPMDDAAVERLFAKRMRQLEAGLEGAVRDEGKLTNSLAAATERRKLIEAAIEELKGIRAAAQNGVSAAAAKPAPRARTARTARTKPAS